MAVAFTGVTAEMLDDTTVRIRWTSSVPTTHNVVRFSTDRRFNYATPLDTTIGTAHEFVIPRLRPRTHYYFKVGGVEVPPDVLFPPVSPMAGRTAVVAPVVDMRLNVFPVARSSPATLATPTLNMMLPVTPTPVGGSGSLGDTMGVLMTLFVTPAGPVSSAAGRGTATLFDPNTKRIAGGLVTMTPAVNGPGVLVAP